MNIHQQSCLLIPTKATRPDRAKLVAKRPRQGLGGGGDTSQVSWGTALTGHTEGFCGKWLERFLRVSQEPLLILYPVTSSSEAPAQPTLPSSALNPCPGLNPPAPMGAVPGHRAMCLNDITGGLFSQDLCV